MTDIIQDFYPLSPMQKGMLFQSLLHPGAALYVEQLAVDIEGDVDRSAFAATWQWIVTRNPILRTVFDWSGEEPLQVVTASIVPPFMCRDLAGSTPADEERLVAEYLEEDLAQGFDLEVGPLIRFALLRCAASKSVFVLSYHHILLDGASMALLFEDFKAVYEAILAGCQITVPSRLPYRAFIEWTTKQPVHEAAEFWERYLSSYANPLSDAPRTGGGSITSSETCWDEFLLDARQKEQFVQLTRQRHLTQTSLLQAMWATVLSDLASSNEVVYGCTVSGRPSELPGAEGSIGLFITTVPVRVQLHNNLSLLDISQRIQSDLAGIQPYSSLPLSTIEKCLPGQRPGTLFNSLFVFTNAPLLSSAPAGLSWRIRCTRELTNYDMTVDVSSVDVLRVRITCPGAKYGPAVVKKITEGFHTLLLLFLADDGTNELSGLCEKEASYRSRATQVHPPEKLGEMVATEGCPLIPAASGREHDMDLDPRVLQICRNVLRTDDIGPRSDFFEHGADSLDCVRLTVRLIEEGYPATVQVVYSNPSALELSAAFNKGTRPSGTATLSLPGQRWEAPSEGHNQVSRTNVDTFDVSPVQRAYLQKSNVNPGLYHDQATFTYQGKISRRAIEGAWHHLIEHHPSFRTVYLPNGRGFSQTVVHANPMTPRYHDFRGTPKKNRRALIRRTLAEDLLVPFALDQGSLVRVRLLRLGRRRYLLLQSFHLLAMDGWCFSFVMKDFHDAYRALATGHAPLSPARPPFQHYIDWLARQDQAGSLTFWRGYLKGLTPQLPLPRLTGKETTRHYRVRLERATLPTEVTTAVGCFARMHRVTLNSFYQAAWAVVLRSWLPRSNTVMFGATVSGRPAELSGSAQMVGLFFNDIPVRVDFAEGVISFPDLARSIQTDFLELRRHDFVACDDIKGLLGLRPEDDLFQTLLVFENYPKEEETAVRTDRRTDLREIGAWRREVSDIDVTIYIEPTPTTTLIKVSYLRGIIQKKTVLELLKKLTAVVQRALHRAAISGA